MSVGGRAPGTGEAADVRLRQMMTGYQAGSGEAFDQLYVELAPVLRRCLLALARDASSVDDLVQETFLQLHRARGTYNPAFPVRPWALAIARHVFLMNRRSRRRHREFEDHRLENADGVVTAGHEHAYAVKDMLRQCLRVLTATTRRAVVLHHGVGLTFEEVGAILGIRQPAAKLRVNRAVVSVRRKLGPPANACRRRTGAVIARGRPLAPAPRPSPGAPAA